MKTHIKRFARKVLNMFIPTESMTESKDKWNRFAKENSSYYIMTDYGDKITEEQFRTSGERDCKELILKDELLNRHLSPFNNKDVLEIGCGTGRITEFTAKNFHSISGVDISEEMINKGKERLKSSNNIFLKATDGMTIPFNDSSFDLVFSFIVFQHMPDKNTINKNIIEISRVLKHGGIAKIQLRGIPTSKKNWFYGVSYTVKEVKDMISSLPLDLIKTQDEGKKYFWIWLMKK